MDARRLICVIGGGISGLTFASLIRTGGGEVLVLEQSQPADTEDGKSVVISAASAAILEKAGADLAHAAPLSCLRVCFENAPGGMELAGNAVGFGISHRRIQSQLAESLGDSFCAPVQVSSLSQPDDSEGGMEIVYRTDHEQKTVRAAAAIVACELPGLPSPFVAREHDFGQAVLSLTAEADNFAPGLAVESFTHLGIVALVPRADGKTGVIVCAEDGCAGALSALSEDDLLTRVNDCFGGEFGLHSPSAKFVFAPRSRRVSPLSAGRTAMLGAGATVLHPAGAQGLNLGLADADCLSKLLLTSADVDSALRQYHQRRTPVHRAVRTGTNLLAIGGHLRQLPFRVLGGAASAGLSAVLLPFRENLLRLLGEKQRHAEP